MRVGVALDDRDGGGNVYIMLTLYRATIGFSGKGLMVNVELGV